MSTQTTPVVVFAYNRPNRLRRLLESLARCDDVDRFPVVIFCDGSRGGQDRDDVASVRIIAREWASGRRVEIIEADCNLGLFNSVTQGVTRVCRQYDRVIVLEDDLEVAPAFLRYMQEALDRYDRNELVWQISGYMFPVIHPESPSAFFLPFITTWGWATWRRAWERVDFRASGAHGDLSDPVWCRRFDLNNAYPYSDLLQCRLANRNQSWGILLYWAVFRAGGLALHPSRSLVAHRGVDGPATHYRGKAGWRDDLQSRDWIEVVWPDRLAVDEEALARVSAFLRAHSRMGYARAWLRRMMGSLFGFGIPRPKAHGKGGT